MSGWEGSSILSTSSPPLSISGRIEYAVFAPGKFDLAFGAGADPSNGTQYVYAYQVYNTGVAMAGGRVIASESVNLLPDNQAVNIESLPLIYGNYGLVPAASAFAGNPHTSARWVYTTATIPLGSQSQILLFTSPKGPTRGSSSISGGGLSATTVPAQYVPTPVPEPATWGLLAMGGCALLFVRRRMVRS